MTAAADVALAVGAVALGALIGTATGLLPGLHVNTVAPVVLAGALAVGGTAAGGGLGVTGAAMLLVLSVATVHTVLNVVPTLAAPIPDEGTELMLLPVQRLAREGRALEALVVSVRGSWIGGLGAAAVGLAVLFAVPHGVPKVPGDVAATVVAMILIMLVTKQRDPWRASVVVLGTGFAGWLVLDVSLVGPFGGDGTVLLPAFAGLFGTPMLLMVLVDRSAAAAPPTAPALGGPRPVPFFPSVIGAACGLLVALFPGLTSATAGTLGRGVRAPRDDLEAVGMLSAVDTANVIGNTIALVVWGAVRSGASSAARNIHPDVSGAGASVVGAWAVATLLAALGLAAWIALRFGARLVVALRRLPAKKVAAGALGLLLLIVVAQSGLAGVVLAACLVPLGMLPHRWGVPRSLLMGFLLVPYLASALS